MNGSREKLSWVAAGTGTGVGGFDAEAGMAMVVRWEAT